MSTRQVAYVVMLAALYIVIGQVVKFLPNQMVPGAIIALNMVVVVIAGITGKLLIYGLAFETVVDIVVILAAVPLLRPLVKKAALA